MGYFYVLQPARWTTRTGVFLTQVAAAIAYPISKSIASLVRGRGTGKDLPFQLSVGLSNRACGEAARTPDVLK